MDMHLNKLQELVMDKEVSRAATHGATKIEHERAELNWIYVFTATTFLLKHKGNNTGKMKIKEGSGNVEFSIFTLVLRMSR